MSIQGADQEPEFISFLFSTKLKYDCFFMVGNKDYVEPERIGVVKAMLMAHSVVLRLELEDSKLAEKGEVAVTDIYPDTFRTLLRYVYGHDTTASLCFDEADNLFYVAEKYLMATLKKKLATRLMSLLSTENICSLLNNPAFYTDLDLNSAITKILRYETDRVLASPLFLGLSANGFIKILEQDGLNVPEIELWRAAIKWAIHNAGSEDGKEFRKQLNQVTKHIRICTLRSEQFFQEVAPLRILSYKEYVSITTAIGKHEKQDELTEFCNEVEPRKLVPKKRMKKVELKFVKHAGISWSVLRDSSFTVVTKECDVELLPLECLALDRSKATSDGATYEVGCTITITHIIDFASNSSNETPVTVRFNKQVKYNQEYEIPLISSNGRNVTLLPNSIYLITMLFDCDQTMFVNSISGYSGYYDNDHLTLNTKSKCLVTIGRTWHYIPINKLTYQTYAG